MNACHLVFVVAVCLLPFSGASARDDDTNKVDVAILDVLLQRGIIDVATYEELMGLAQAEADKVRELDLLENRLRRMQSSGITASGGKPGKFKVESDDGKWSLGFKGRLQLQYNGTQADGSGKDENNFMVRRARLAVFGKAGGENTTYKVEIAAPTQNKVNKDSKKDASVTDAWVNWDLGDRTNVKAGQFKVPYGRAITWVSSKMNTVEASLATRHFALGRQPGLMYYGSTQDKYIEYGIGAFNGEGAGMANTSGRKDSSATGLLWATRVTWNPLGPVNYDSSAFQTVNTGETKLALGAGYYLNQDQPAKGPATAVNPNPVLGDASSDNTGINFNAQLLSGPVSVVTEYFTIEKKTSGVNDKTDRGYNAQVGVQVIPEKWEVVLRQSAIKRAMDDDKTELTLGLVRYVDKHLSQFTFDVSKVRNQTKHENEMQFRGQYQVVF